jgi:hypothetical protein
MHIIRLNFNDGVVLVDSAPIAVDENGVLAESIKKQCLPPIETDEGRTQYRLLKKASICGKSADGVIEVGEGRVCVVTFLFNLIEFFTSSVLESKVLKACEKSFNQNFMSNHPSTAFADFGERGQAVFFYDAKQGDLSLQITFSVKSSTRSSYN